jgi:hypothetical protein
MTEAERVLRRILRGIGLGRRRAACRHQNIRLFRDQSAACLDCPATWPWVEPPASFAEPTPTGAQEP